MRSVVKAGMDAVMDGTTHLLVLDFDGVLNPDKHNGTYPKEYFNPDTKTVFSMEEEGRSKPAKYQLHASSELVSRMNRVFALDGVRVLLLSTWRELMWDAMSRLGFVSDREVFYFNWGGDSNDHRLKVDALETFFMEYEHPERFNDTTLTWADDVLFRKPSRTDFFLRSNGVLGLSKDDLMLPFSQANTHLVGPHSAYGVSREEMDHIDAAHGV